MPDARQYQALNIKLGRNPNINKAPHTEDDPGPMTDYNALKVVELRELLEQRGLDSKGLKKELVDRLEASDAGTLNGAVAPTDSETFVHTPSSVSPETASTTETFMPDSSDSSMPMESSIKPIGEPMTATLTSNQMDEVEMDHEVDDMESSVVASMTESLLPIQHTVTQPSLAFRPAQAL